ncbi:ADP-heptose--lipooligosaccharide heptosyltransferase II, partial [hydrothermal vent metagenome]
MRLDKFKIKKILLISLTNIGDVVLTFPVMDILKRDFPDAKFSIVVGPKAESLLKNNPHLDNLYLFNKHQSGFKMLNWIWQLRKERFDMVIDLRNTAIPFLLGAKHRTPLVKRKARNVHMKEKHLGRLKTVYDYKEKEVKSCILFVGEKDKQYVKELIYKNIGDQKFIIIAPGAADFAKRWPAESFVCAGDVLAQKVKVVLIGGNQDREVADQVTSLMRAKVINLCGQTNLVQSAELIKHSQFVLTNDSAPMHLASYLNIPTLVVFGPTSPQQYGPW